MKEKIHPTHARITRNLMFACFLLSIAPFGATFYVANSNEKLETLFSCLFIVLFATGGLLAAARLFFSKCPECSSWLFRQKRSKIENDQVKFACSKCCITWNSGIKIDD